MSGFAVTTPLGTLKCHACCIAVIAKDVKGDSSTGPKLAFWLTSPHHMSANGPGNTHRGSSVGYPTAMPTTSQ
eukprot:4179265-Pyramimonas_sp.AAC.1